ncbi:gustatory receptor for sugar taste 64f [Nomia melanderi]|uniref:gustatory receptor for sugar taste 64f n=1 Tax=Nomia melanderi TaxID=2448451 RepID=UPI00130459A7|nr:gustatory receptor for sugar taste 64f-like [Nomia melanderi]XP_031833759.1 gustatory receptor for sugar taste 64f-like [Nomia melanderi]XP_031833760.1 gustatory receptor for sugar taste 64f-like [Nomia melanderi]XP_031833761.1 gustatory receptor for sugar taste 64f-like [Nomia melanderi]XP_031833762.1 gustatory receptor for sugar taste 64f-like [Nomia melanderi]XP_031833763.1 gustatory receptor for sugar taste 64f-like [Nomia melanderi]XP_031833764.1 gustatory receptor for sugar taste 64f
MVSHTQLYTIIQVMPLRMEIALNELPTRNNRLSKKIPPLAIYRKNDNHTEELNMDQTGSSRNEYQHRRSYSSYSGNSESFQCAIGPILSIAQIFGIFPVSGIRSTSPSKLHFNPLSFLTIYSVFVTVMILFATTISMIYMFKTLNAETFQMRGGIGAATVGAVFYGNSLLGLILFFWLSSRWASFQCEYRAMEQYIDRNSSERSYLRWKFLLISTVVLLLALIEHILSILKNAEGYDWCSPQNSSFRNFLEIYSLRSHAFIFDILDYNFTFGVYIFLISKVATFTWNFTDLFLMLVSSGLAERYKVLNRKLALTVANNRSTIGWQELREDYAILSSIVKKVDDHVSPIILLSFANNLYFICLQLLNGLSTAGDSSLLNTIYFFGSFVFLIGRTAAVTLFSAKIYDESKRALPYLYNCSASSYGIEAQRLQYQLATDDVALTGLRFFSITRNFMLAMAGAIVTYEIVLLQFNGERK